MSLNTPLGRILVFIDDNSVEYNAVKLEPLQKVCRDVKGRYYIKIHFTPDGKEHEIKCILEDTKDIKAAIESDRLECQGFYNKERWKLSMGIESDAGYLSSGRRVSDYDYDGVYLKNGMSFIILPNTKTEDYVFGISWIDNVGYYDEINNENRDNQTWFGADPTYYDR